MGCGGSFYVFFVIRVMPFVMGDCVFQFIVCSCVVGFIVLGFAGGVVDKLDR